MMRYYPVNLDIAGKTCLVVGGGGVATRKVKSLLSCGAVVTAVSPEFSKALLDMAQMEKLTLVKRPYADADLEGKFLVIGATDIESLNRRISADAQQRNMLCNIADVPDACNFILPSVISRGDLIIAISTSGKSPAFAKRLRKELETSFGDEYARFLELMGAIREKLLREAHTPEAHKPLFEKLIDGGLLELIRKEDVEAINRLLNEVLGAGYAYETLLPPENE